MPIYTARVPTGSLKPTPALDVRGILLRASPASQLNILGFAHYRQIAYGMYADNIVTFMQATILNTPVSTLRAFHKIAVKAAQQVPFPAPPVVISFKSNVSSEEEQALLKLGCIRLMAKKDVIYRFPEGVLRADTLSVIKQIKADIIPDTVGIGGSTNLAGFQSFLKIRSIITAFACTQYYPAFVGPSTRPPITSSFESFSGFATLKRKALTPTTRNTAARMEIDGPADEDEEEEAEVEYEDLSVQPIPMANPPDANANILAFGPPSAMPQTCGNVFPYFSSLMDDDARFIGLVTREKFITAFGSSPAENLEEWRKFDAVCGTYAASDAGHIINHALIGVKLAMEVQGRVFFIFHHDRYVGFSLHGYYYDIHLGGQTFAPDSMEVVLSDARNMDEHTSAIAMILAVCSRSKGGATRAKGKKATEFETPRKLRSFIAQFKGLQDEDKIEIDKLSTKLVFPQTYWAWSSDNYIAAIDLLLSGSEPSEDMPMYPVGLLTTDDVHLSVFALFGDYGFSFLCPGGTGKRLPKDEASDTLFAKTKGKDNKMKTPSINLVIAKKGLQQCVKDWSDFLRTRTWVTREQRSSAFRSDLLTGEHSKKVWFALIKAIPMPDDEEVLRADTVVGPAAKKRKLDDDDVDFTDFL